MDRVDLIAKTLHDDACRCAKWPCGNAHYKVEPFHIARKIARVLYEAEQFERMWKSGPLSVPE